MTVLPVSTHEPADAPRTERPSTAMLPANGSVPDGAAMRIQLCGNLAVEVGGRDRLDALPGRQGRLIFAYLVINRGRPVRRDELIEVVWQDELPTAPAASLSSLLTGVRRVVGQTGLSGRSSLTLTLPRDAWIDVETARAATHSAEAALAAGDASTALDRARAALALTRRPVLPELQGEWVELLRTELAQLRCDQLETATRAALALGEPATAERLARNVVELEPYRESGYGLLMEALVLGGNVAEALLVFEHVRVLLRDELGVPPARALTALHERLLGHGDMQLSKPTPLPPVLPLPTLVDRSERRTFVARASELERLRKRWAHARRGEGELVLLTGEPGIGKTRLAARFAAEVHAGGGTVLYGRADEETVVPFQPFVEALRHLVAHVDPSELDPLLAPRLEQLRPLLPEIGGGAALPATGDSDRYSLFESAAALLDRVARHRPLLLLLEDLHWADKPTLLLLRQVVRQAEAAPMMVLATYSDAAVARATSLQRVLADLRREHVIERVWLRGLDRDDTAALVESRAGDALDVRCVERLQEYTAGNPFFIEETIRSGGRGPVAAPPCSEVVGVPDGVREMLLLRIERLTPATVEVVTLASVLGREFSLQVLQRLTGRDADDVLAGLEEAATAGLIVEDPEQVGRFAFCHELVRDTIYGHLAASRRRLLHLRAGEALEAVRAQVAGPAAELAHQFFLARHGGGLERAVAYGIEAGEQAARAQAYEDAAGHFERALTALDVESRDDDGETRTRCWLALGAVRWQGGEPGARDAYLAAAAIAQRRGDSAALVAAVLGAGGRFYVHAGPDPAYVALLDEALAASNRLKPAVRARILARLAEALPDGARRCETGAEAVAVARESGDAATLASALLSRHATLLHARHLAERLALGEEAVATADRHGLRESAALARHWLIYDDIECGNRERAQNTHMELERLAHALHQPLFRHSSLAWRGVCAQLDGRLEEAERLAREGLRLAERAGARDARAHFTAQLLPVLREQGRLPELLPDLRRLSAEGSQVLAWSAVLPLAFLDAGQSDHAAEALAAAGNEFAGPLWLPATAWFAEAAARLGDTTTCTDLFARLEPHAGRLVQAGFGGCWGAVDRFLGLLSAAVGRRDEALRHFDAALAQHMAIGADTLARRTRRDRDRLSAG